MNIVDIIKSELSETGLVVKIIDKDSGLRLLKKSERKYKYVFSFNEILREFQSVEGLLNELKNRGFRNTTFVFQRLYEYGHSTTYKTIKVVNYNILNHMDVNTTINHTPPMQPIPQGLGFMAGINQDPSMMLGALINSERLGDYKERVRELEENLKDLRSENRQLREENSSLKLKNETAEERANLKIQTELLQKKGFLENEGVQELLRTAVQIAPGLIQPASAVAPATQTGGMSGVSLSPLHENLINTFEDAQDLTKTVAVELLQRDELQLNKSIVRIIKKYEEKQTQKPKSDE